MQLTTLVLASLKPLANERNSQYYLDSEYSFEYRGFTSGLFGWIQCSQGGAKFPTGGILF